MSAAKSDLTKLQDQIAAANTAFRSSVIAHLKTVNLSMAVERGDIKQRDADVLRRVRTGDLIVWEGWKAYVHHDGLMLTKVTHNDRGGNYGYDDHVAVHVDWLLFPQTPETF